MSQLSLNNCKIGIVGLGYVGLPLAAAFGKHFKTVGFDIKAARVEELRKGRDRTLEVERAELRAEELLAMEGRVNVVAIAVGNLKAIPAVQRAIRTSLPPALADQLAVLSWEEVIPELKQSMEFDKIGDWFFFVILIVIVTFGILNTILMSVTERFREFGVVLALGMRPVTIAVTVMLETAFIAVAGIIVGGAAGYAVNVRLEAYPIPLSGEFVELSMRSTGSYPRSSRRRARRSMLSL